MPAKTTSLCVRSAGILFLPLALACASAHQVHRIPPCPGGNCPPLPPGITYALPRSVIHVEVPVTQTITLPGKFAEFAPELLGIAVQTKREREFEIGEPTITHSIEADPEALYRVELQNKNPFVARKLALTLSELGLLTQAESKAENKTIDFAVSVAGAGAGILAKAIPVGAANAGLNALKSANSKAAANASDLDAYIRSSPKTRTTTKPDEDWVAAMKELVNKPEGSKAAAVALLLELQSAVRVPGPKATLSQVLSTLETHVGLQRVAPLRKAVDALPVCQGALYADSVLDEISNLVDAIADHATASALRESLDTFSANDATIDFSNKTKNVLLDDNGPRPGQANAGPTARLAAALGVRRAVELARDIQDPSKRLCYAAPGDQIGSEVSKDLLKELRRVVAITVAERIQDVQERRRALLDGTELSDVSSESLALILRELATEEERLAQQFVGKKVEAVWKARFRHIPAAGAGLPVSLCLLEVFSTEGVAAPTTNRCPSVSTLPGFDTAPPREFAAIAITSPPGTLVTVELGKSPGSLAATMNGQGSSGRGRRGFAYRVPEKVSITATETPAALTSGGQLHYPPPGRVRLAVEMPAPQLGVIEVLPARAGVWKGATYNLTLDPNTGGLRTITLEGTAADGSAIKGLSDAYQVIQAADLAQREKELAAAKAEAEKKAAAQDEVNALTRKKQILELQKAIAELEKRLPVEAQP